MNRRVIILLTAAVIVSVAAFVSCTKDKTPVISIAVHPSNADVVMSSITGRLTVEASVTGKATLAYQWYSNTTASNTSGTEIGGATTANYDIPTNLAAGKYYYFCEVRATGAASVRSYVATVTVTDLATFDNGVLINGVTWATRNVDAPGTFAEKPESLGMLYQWNRRIGWSTTEPMISSPSGNTWNSTAASGSIWITINDPCPSGWHLPTKTDLEKLIAAGSTWAPRNGVAGRTFGSGANTIFLPAAGYRSGGTLSQVSNLGAYNSSTEGFDNTRLSGINLNSSGANMVNDYKNDANSCRCVKD